MKSVTLLLGLVLSGSAHGCECFHGLLDERDAAAAKHVFIFELQEVRLKDPPADEQVEGVEIRPREATGRIRVLQTLRGSADAFTQIEYSISHCCGIRLGLGERYVAFVDESGPMLHANGGNVLGPGPLFEQMMVETPVDPFLFKASWNRLDMVGLSCGADMPR